MTNYEKILSYAQREPRFRERKNKDRGIVNLLIERYPTLKEINKDILVEMVKDYNSLDRAWREVMADHKELQGSDYHQKAQLVFNKQQELGYYPK